MALHLTAAQISTVAGTGTSGYSGDGGPAIQAQINNPYGVIRGPDQTVYVCDMDNHRIRRIDVAGRIETIAGTGRRGYSGDGGPAHEAELNEPYEIRFGPAGDLFWVEMRGHVVRKMDAKTRRLSTVAGTGQPGFSGDGGPAIRAELRQPHSIQFDPAGDLYICDIGNHRVRKIAMKTGLIDTFAGTGQPLPTPDGATFRGTPLNGPRALDFDAEGHLWLALREGNAVYRLDLGRGTIHHEAGTGEKGFAGNGGPARLAQLSGPKGLSVAPNGDVYLADTESHSIRKIDRRKGTLERVAGTGARGDGPEPNPLECRLARPHGVFVDRDGKIWIGDSEAHRVRVIAP